MCCSIMNAAALHVSKGADCSTGLAWIGCSGYISRVGTVEVGGGVLNVVMFHQSNFQFFHQWFPWTHRVISCPTPYPPPPPQS
jgi:hypothetical protein